MVSDCEMTDLDQDAASKPVSSPLLNHNGNVVNVVPIDNESKPVASSVTATASNTIPASGDAVVSGSDGAKNSAINSVKNSTKSKGDKPASASTAKPRSTKPPRSPSPSPPPVPPRPPLQTIRLDIKLGGPGNYEVDIAALAKTTGQRSSTPVPMKRDTSDSEGEGDGEDESKGQPKDKKKRRKNVPAEYYDTSDPFIDDSDLPMDERTFFAQTKQQGFYVSSGEVALLKDKTPKKPKSKKINLGPISKVASNGSVSQPKTHEGSPHSPIPVPSENEDDKKRKSHDDHGDGSKKRKTTEVRPFHAELEAAFEGLRAEIAKESWVKGKFPPILKPLLAQVALKAVVLGEYDENFFNYMPKLFPYNKYTMSKLIKRTIWKEHMAILTDRQTELLEELAELTTEGFPKAQEEWEKSVAAWEKKQEKIKEAVEAGSASGDASVSAPVQPPGVDDAAASGTEQDAAPKTAAKESHPPAKKYRMTEPIKNIIWQLVCLSNECCRIENEKNGLEGTGQTVSEQGVRKVLYQKILHSFPEGWISSGQISREVSSMKKKYEKESLAED